MNFVDIDCEKSSEREGERESSKGNRGQKEEIKFSPFWEAFYAYLVIFFKPIFLFTGKKPPVYPVHYILPACSLFFSFFYLCFNVSQEFTWIY